MSDKRIEVLEAVEKVFLDWYAEHNMYLLALDGPEDKEVIYKWLSERRKEQTSEKPPPVGSPAFVAQIQAIDKAVREKRDA